MLASDITVISKEDKKTKRIAVGLAIVLLLFPALALNCGGSGEENNYIVSPKEAVKWIEEIPFTCTYSQERPAEQAYMVCNRGTLCNISLNRVTVSSVIFRYYDTAKEVVGEHTVDMSLSYREGLDPNVEVDEYIEDYYAQEVDCFDVFVTDGKGNEYLCYKDGAECE